MNIHLNVNDLVEQLIELTRHQNEAMKKVSALSTELSEVKDRLMLKELHEAKSKVDHDREINQMATHYEAEQLNVALSKIVNG